MPYILEHQRRILDPEIERLGDQVTEAGQLAYVAYRLSGRFFRHAASGRQGYLKMATIIGVLVCTCFELYRRLITPYEDKKRTENGDVPL